MTETEELTACAECGNEFDPAYCDVEGADDLCDTCRGHVWADHWHDFTGWGR